MEFRPFTKVRNLNLGKHFFSNSQASKHHRNHLFGKGASLLVLIKEVLVLLLSHHHLCICLFEVVKSNEKQRVKP